LYVVVFSLVLVLITTDFATVKNVQERVGFSHPDVAGWSGEYSIDLHVLILLYFGLVNWRKILHSH